MKAVTEFANITLSMALKTKAALVAEGKTPEEIQASLGTSYKLEGEKLGYFLAALDVAASNADNLKRVLVMRLDENDRVPPKATKVEELHYVPEFHVSGSTKQPPKGDKKGGRGGRGREGGGKGGPKESPWGLSPEEKAAKAAKSAAAKAAKPS